MTCEIKSGHHPIQIHCSFPDVNQPNRDFSVYFHSYDGSQNPVASCIFNGRNKCLAEEGFDATLEGLNAATITVPDSFATKTGMFVCQKGDLPFIKNCQFPVLDNSTAVTSLKPEVGYGTATNVIPSFVTTELSGNKDDDWWIIICAVAVSAIIVIFLILSTIIWLKKYKNKKGRERFNKQEINEEIHPKIDEECKRSFIRKESKSQELVPGQLSAELTRILVCNIPTNGQDFGNEIDFIGTKRR